MQKTHPVYNAITVMLCTNEKAVSQSENPESPYIKVTGVKKHSQADLMGSGFNFI